MTIAPDGLPAFRADARRRVGITGPGAHKAGRALVISHDLMRAGGVLDQLCEIGV